MWQYYNLTFLYFSFFLPSFHKQLVKQKTFIAIKSTNDICRGHYRSELQKFHYNKEENLLLILSIAALITLLPISNVIPWIKLFTPNKKICHPNMYSFHDPILHQWLCNKETICNQVVCEESSCGIIWRNLWFNIYKTFIATSILNDNPITRPHNFWRYTHIYKNEWSFCRRIEKKT